MSLTAVEFRRGWPVLVAAALGTAFGASPIPFNSAGPFTQPLAEEFGWGRGDIQLALFWFTAAVVLTVPYIGGLADRIGVRKVAIGWRCSASPSPRSPSRPPRCSPSTCCGCSWGRSAAARRPSPGRAR